MLLLLVQVAFSRVQFGNIFPLGFSFAIARLFFGGNLFVVTLEYAISCLFLVKDFYFLIAVAYEIIILSLYYFSKEMFKTKRKKLVLYLFLLLSFSVELYLSISGKIYWRDFLIESGLKCLALAYFLKIHLVYQKKFIFLKCSNLDYSLFSIFILFFILGLFSYNFLASVFGLTSFLASVLLCCRFLPSDKYLVFAITLALSFGYIFGSVKFVLIAVVFSVLVLYCSKLYKYLFLSLSLFLLYLILRVSNELVLKNIISLVAGVLLVACVPQKVVGKFSEFFEEKTVDIIKENIWQEKERDIKQNLNLMAKTLTKMKDDFKFLIVGKIDRRYASKELAEDVIGKCCEKCERRNICENTLIDKRNLLTEYIFHAMHRGELSVDELSLGFRTYCNKVIQIVKEINLISKKFLEFETSVKTEDESKLLISTELQNFANLFQNFAKNIEKSPKINKNLSLIAKEMLLNSMIEVGDIAVFESSDGIEKIDIVAENSVMLRKELSIELSKIVRSKVQVKKLRHLDFSGLSLVSFGVATTLRAEFAVATSSKEEVSGDNTMISKIDDNRFFVAIADGMGHGKVAGKTSSMILELIKNMFYIGIDLNIIIESINNLLFPVGLDNFSTLDVAIVDLRLAKCTFIKLGSSVSAIKHKDKTEIISSESLPVGIVQNLTPTIVVKPVQPGDVVVLASDGVVDNFSDIEKYQIFINDYKIDKLQRFADNVIFELGTAQVKHKDDMSLIALKLLKNSLK